MDYARLIKLTKIIVIVFTPFYLFSFAVGGFIPENAVTGFLGFLFQYTPTIFLAAAGSLISLFLQVPFGLALIVSFLLVRYLIWLIVKAGQKQIDRGRVSRGRVLVWLVLLSETLPLLIGLGVYITMQFVLYV